MNNPPPRTEDKKFLVIGNSISIHGVCSYWFGTWGMAASRKEYDYVHRVANTLGNGTPIPFDIMNFAGWEVNAHDRAELLPMLDRFSSESYAFVIVQLGENVPVFDIQALRDLEDMLCYLKKILIGTPKILLLSSFPAFQRSPQMVDGLDFDEAKRHYAKMYDMIYIDISSLKDENSILGINAIVFGDDGKQYQLSHPGVAIHPNDYAMNVYAKKILAAL